MNVDVADLVRRHAVSNTIVCTFADGAALAGLSPCVSTVPAEATALGSIEDSLLGPPLADGNASAGLSPCDTTVPAEATETLSLDALFPVLLSCPTCALGVGITSLWEALVGLLPCAITLGGIEDALLGPPLADGNASTGLSSCAIASVRGPMPPLSAVF